MPVLALVRRGTNAERLTVVLAQGEPAWTTDTKRFYVGDGSTVGGIPVMPATPTDAEFRVVGSSDATKRLAFEVDAQSTGAVLTLDTGTQTTSRTLTVPQLSAAAKMLVTQADITNGGRVPMHAAGNANILSQSNLRVDAITGGVVNLQYLGSDQSFLLDASGGTIVSSNGSFTYASSTTQTLFNLTVTNGITLPSASVADAALSANIARLGTANTWTAAQTFRAANAVRSEAAATQDAIVLAGRAGGSSSYAVTITPGVLSGNQTITAPDASGTLALLEREQKFTIRQRIETAGPTQGLQGDPAYVAGVLTTRTLGAGDALGDRYEVFRVGDGRGSAGTNRLGVFHRRGSMTGTWEYTQWCIGRYVDNTVQTELRFGGENSTDAITAICSEFGFGVEPTAGNGRIQLPTHTTPAGGVGLGPDVFIYRVAANQLDIAGAAGSDVAANVRRSSGENIILLAGNGAVQVGSTSAHQVQLIAGSAACGVVKTTGQIRFIPLSADPGGAETGDVYYNSTTNKLRVYNGAWVDLH